MFMRSHIKTGPASAPKEFFAPAKSMLLQRKCACGGSPGLSGQCDECNKNRLTIQRRAKDEAGPSTPPPIVRDALSSPGQALDADTRTFMESRLGHDFSRTRIHTDAKAAESAQAMHALAYTVGRDVVFGAGSYSPATMAGKSLLAHELAHVVQQSQGPEGGAEPRAEAAAERVVRGEAMTPGMIGGASPGLHAQNDGEQEERRTPTVEPAFSLGWDTLAQLGSFQLQPPALTIPSAQPSTLGLPALAPPSLGAAPLRRPTLPSPSASGPISLTPPFTPPTQTNTSTPDPPSRLPVLSRGQFSLGLRLGFPEAEAREIPGAPPSASQESLQRAEIMNQRLTGSVPTGWEAIDKAKLARAIWGIFSTQIAPDLARNITRGLSVPSGPGGASLELDIVLLTDFSGGGLSFTIRH